MSYSTNGFTPVSEPMRMTATLSQSAANRLAAIFTGEQLDAALDSAARAARATVACFAAAPVDCWADHDDATGLATIEFVVEFFVPPPSLDTFHRELEAQLLRTSPRYVTGRYQGEFAPCALQCVGGGTFHQYRVTCRASAADQRETRWSRDRVLLDGILHQARTGWRELDT